MRSIQQRRLWKNEQTLFHNFKRYIDSPEGTTDRLLSVLERGLIAPGHDDQGNVISDLKDHLHVEANEVPYDEIIFLHRYSEKVSYPYMFIQPDQVQIIVDPALNVKTPGEMGKNWCRLAMDEVYSLEPIPPENFKAVFASKTYLGEQVVQAALRKSNIPHFSW